MRGWLRPCPAAVEALRALTALTALTASILISACGGGGGSSSSGTGTMGVSLTDVPACGFNAVNVTIQKVRVHQSSTAAPTDAGWTDITLANPMRVDLLTLTNGVLVDLGQTPLPAGHYQQMRLVLVPNDAVNPLANSVVPSGGVEVPLSTPSAVQSGIKMNADINIAADQMADFLIDFSACQSVVTAGSGQFLLKPVLTVTPLYVSGVQGFVDPTLANGNTTVSLQDGSGNVFRATTPDSTGKFVLVSAAPGTYTVVVAALGRATAVLTGVAVAADTVTSVNTSSSPITPPASQSGTLSGKVSATAPIQAEVAALQALSDGETIQVATKGADSVSGAYALTVPVAAPVVGTFAGTAPPATLSFVADVPVAGTYTLEATSGGAIKMAGPVIVPAGGTATINFTFP